MSTAPEAGEAAAATCSHYKRGCQLLAPCCSEFFPCRFCHDAVKNEGEKDPKKRHTMDRHKVVSVRCRTCATVQPPQQKCTSCGTIMGTYFCGVCNLFDDEGAKKQIFHCDGCGICRVGGRETFFHCDKCQACFAIALKGSHKCIEGNLKQDCPVCLEDMHTSRSAATLLKCGHAMHGSCLTDCLKGGNYRCPLCSSSIVDMSRYWRETDVECALTLMPAEYASTWVRVLCNDCHGEADTPWHIGGLKCRTADPEKRKARLARAAMRAASGAAAAATGAAAAAGAGAAGAAAADAAGDASAAAGAAAGATEASGAASTPVTAEGGGAATEPPAASGAPAAAAAAGAASADAAFAGAAAAATIEPVWEDWCGSYNTRKVGTAPSAEHEGPAAAAFEAAWREAVLQSAASRMNPALAALLAAGAGGAGDDSEEEDEDEEDEEGLAGEGEEDTDDDDDDDEEDEDDEDEDEDGSGEGAAGGVEAEGRGSRAAAGREGAGGRGMDVDDPAAAAPAGVAGAGAATAAAPAGFGREAEAEGRHRAATADTVDSMVSARGEDGTE